jgi:inner membrane protein
MDPLTHALAGAALARASAPRHPREDRLSVRARVAAGTLAAVFPDLDGLLLYVSPIVYLDQHRGLTHSVLLLPLWSFLLAWLFARLARDRRGWRPWFGICALGIASHTALDVVTSYGTMLAAPVSWHRFSLRSTFIIDLWLSSMLAAGLLASLAFRRSRLPATMACAAVVAYVGFQLALHERAQAFGVAHAVANRLDGATVVAHPGPVSPFNWSVYVQTGEHIHSTHVNLMRRRAQPEPSADAGFIDRLDAPYRPLHDADWKVRSRFGETKDERRVARSAWLAGELGFFRRFAELPVYDGTTPGSRCVWFFDLRFAAPGRGTVPFRYGACREAADARWRAYQVDKRGQLVRLIP